VVALACAAIAACAPARRVTRTSSDTVVDLSGRWNDTDSRLTAEALVEDVLAAPWVERFVAEHEARLPDGVVGTIRNRSTEHIQVGAIVGQLERSLVNSGKVNFVASGTAREEIRREREDMAHHASDESFKGPGQEAGADFILQGSIVSEEDVVEGRRVVQYIVGLELVDLATNRKVWVGEKKIKKDVEQARVSF
jgi:hypothetical protein